MKNIPKALQSHLKRQTTTLAWCWLIILKDKSKIGFTDHDRNIQINNTICRAKSGFNASEIEASLGLAADNMEVTAALSHPNLSEDDLEQGKFDNAEVEIWRVNYNDTKQKVLMRKGNLGEVTRNENMFSAEIKGIIAQMQKVGGRVFQYGCDANLGDKRCRVDLNLPKYTGMGRVIEVQGSSRIKAQIVDQNQKIFKSKWFQYGTLSWTTGNNKGRIFEVKLHQNEATYDVVELWQSNTKKIQNGDQFIIKAGCDKQIKTCKDKFKNIHNFRGFPHMPGNDFVLSYPNSDDPYKNGESIIAG